jgi:hypothetical protein
MGVMLYLGIPSEITQGMSVPTLSWVQHEGGGKQMGAIPESDCNLHYFEHRKILTAVMLLLTHLEMSLIIIPCQFINNSFRL